jgi:2-oxoglutarate dehydrogenase E2 component (dihydrolipoamide succinyltransferase)
MRVDMVMPQMGESIAEGTIVKWLKGQGDVVRKDENILEISTDKVDSEIPSPAEGRIVELLVHEGETVPVGSVVARIETDAGAVAAEASGSPEGARGKAAAPAAERGKTAPTASEGERGGKPAVAAKPSGREEKGGEEDRGLPRPTAPSTTAGEGPGAVAPPPAAQPSPGRDGEGRFYSPLVRSIAQAEGIALSELSRIHGSGQGGRVTKEDLLKYVAERTGGAPVAPSAQGGISRARDTAPPAAAPAPMPAIAMPKPSETRSTPDGLVDVVAMDHIRQRIAEHMVRSKATSPHVASVTEVDMTRIVRWREKHKEAFEKHEGFKLTFTPFFVQATARALKEFPYVNASIEGTSILVKRFVNMGIAVATDYGLIVPVLRGADALSFVGIARGVSDLATRARSKGLKPDEVAGGTFSITNMGTVGTLFGVPIIAQPQVGILGIGAIQKRPVVIDDAIAIRDMMYMCLSYDHRLIDGAMGGSFVERVAQYLETMDLG